MEGYNEEDICLCFTEREIMEIEANYWAEEKNLRLDNLPSNKAKNDQSVGPCNRDESKVLLNRPKIAAIYDGVCEQSQRLDEIIKQIPSIHSDCHLTKPRKKSKMLNSEKDNGKEKTSTETSEAKKFQCDTCSRNESKWLMILDKIKEISNVVHDLSQQLEIILKQSCPLHYDCCIRAKSSEPPRKKSKMLNSEKENGKEKTSTETSEAKIDQCETPFSRFHSKADVVSEVKKLCDVLYDQEQRLIIYCKQLCPLHSDCCVRAKSSEPSRRKSKMLNSETEKGKEKTSTETSEVSTLEEESEH